MHLDIQTLVIVTVFVTAVLGALLMFAGLQNRAVRAPTLWGSSFLLGAVGVGLLVVRGDVPDWLSIHVANALILLSLAMIWAGARMFDGKPVRVSFVLATPVLWMVVVSFPVFAADINARILLVSALTSILALGTAWEIWSGRAEPLLSRWPTACTLSIFAGAMLVRIVVNLMMPLPQDEQNLATGALFPLLVFGTLLFTVVLAFLLLNMIKERTELQHKTAALIDPLSGVPNRRAFLAGAERLIAQQHAGDAPLAVFLFDLDHFKAVNDRLGHAAGDAVLKTFAVSATRALGPQVLFGRIGGEEFAALMPAGDVGEATANADRVRRTFAAAVATYAKDGVVPTVSVGVALTRDAAQPLASLLAAADRALYRAKANGRNRVENAASEVIEAGAGPRPNLVPEPGDAPLRPKVFARA